MKTAILLFALVFGWVIPTYSQMNRHRKTDARAEQFSAKQNKENDRFGKYKFDDKFPGSWSDRVGDSYSMSSVGPARSKNTEEVYSGDNMPCFKPEGMFSMRVYKPDSTVEYTMLVKKFETQQRDNRRAD